MISYAQSHLAQPDGRAKYELSLSRDSEQEFARSISFALEGLTSLDPGTRHVLLDEAASPGFNPIGPTA